LIAINKKALRDMSKYSITFVCYFIGVIWNIKAQNIQPRNPLLVFHQTTSRKMDALVSFALQSYHQFVLSNSYQLSFIATKKIFVVYKRFYGQNMELVWVPVV